MKKIIIGLAVVLVGSAAYIGFRPETEASKESTKSTIKQTQSVDHTKKEKEAQAFKTYNETLIKDIYGAEDNQSPNEKRESLSKRMTPELVDMMCRPIGDPNAKQQSQTKIVESTMLKVKELAKDEKETVTRFVIEAPTRKQFPMAAKAHYVKKEKNWIMDKVEPVQEEQEIKGE
ncbi:hypothetical protein [Vagococcus fessus]|uniref:Uncharacterized protein n=1 Tax=Vagococcus fessus TaxID=120370 RepID=A0A430ACW1_9ENTE|nr:hypothetical protein [Vagococcus fessus]RSU05050.1 hypothetical protein CBF31_03265 [Vagococcus fessus]